jgi:ankyrin repeat protein
MRRIRVIPLLIFFTAVTVAAQTPSIVDASSIHRDAAEPDKAAEEALIESIKQNDVGRLRQLLDGGVSPNATDDGTPLIVLAVRLNHAEIAELLLSRKAKVDQVENDDTTALQVAAIRGQANLVKLLIAHGADVNLGDHEGHTALLMAAFGVVFKSAPEWLVKSFLGADDAEDDQLLKNMGSEHLECVKLLLQAGADVNAQGADCGTSALMVAAMGGNVELTKLLLEHHADVNLSNGEDTALNFAEMFESPKELQEQLSDSISAEHKQAFFDWAHFTASGRTLVAGLLRQAGAK